MTFELLTMFSWLDKDDQRKREPEVYASVAEGLKKLYQQVYSMQSFFIFNSFSLFILALIVSVINSTAVSAW